MSTKKAFIKINGIEFPCPSRGLQYMGSQIVDSARNAEGIVISQKINRRQQKINNLKWEYLKADVWESMLQEIAKFDGVIQFYSPYSRSWVEMNIYWGDDSSEPLLLDKTDNTPVSYINCSCNVIDKGEPIVIIN